MLVTVLVIGGAVAAWLLVDRLLLWRDERSSRGRAAWSGVVKSRSFHSTGWEETVPPIAALSSHQPDRLRASPSRRNPQV